MGIKGLTSFVDENLKSLLKHHRLHDTKVIIDGNNFIHCLYHELNISCVYGGDYHLFSKKLKRVFGAFQACNVHPYMVFDGAYEVDNRKINTIKDRARDRIRAVSNMPQTGRGRLLPLLASATLFLVLEEFKISYCTCTFEADDQIAALANEWNCPVLSNDSDFFVFNLSAGFIPLDYLNYKAVLCEDSESSHYVMPCMLYTMKNFLSFYTELNSSSLPLFAVLCGNDCIDPSTFAGIISYEHQTTRHHDKIRRILSWLETQGDAEKAIKRFKDAVKSKCEYGVQQLVDQTLSSYMNPSWSNSFSLSEFFKESNSVTQQNSSPSVLDFAHISLPDWFIYNLHCSKISVLLLNVAISHQVFLLCQAEDTRQVSAYHISKPIREIIYRIILKRQCPVKTVGNNLCGASITTDIHSQSHDSTLSSDDDDESCDESMCDRNEANHQPDSPIDESSSDAESLSDSDDTSHNLRYHANKSSRIIEFDRKQTDLKKNTIILHDKVIKNIDIPCLDDIPSLTCESKLELMKNILCPFGEKKTSFSQDLELIIFLMFFWIRRANPLITENHLKAQIVGILFMHFKSFKENLSISRCSSSEIYTAFTTSSEKQLKCLANNLEKFTQDCSSVVVLDVKIIHGFSQFQCCFWNLMHLNELLLHPITCLDPRAFFHGLFLYNFCNDLSTRKNIPLFIQEMLVKNSPIAELYDSIYDEVMKMVDESCFLDSQMKAKSMRVSSKQKQCAYSKKKKAKLKKGSKNAQNRSKKSRQKSRSNVVSVNNKFSCLSCD